ncbi:hypothetical protein CCP3SC15_2750002 [Gammaproteobacteria bacterium]
MSKYPGQAVIKALDYLCWAIAIGFAFSLDWKAGVAIVVYDLMRAFEVVNEKLIARQPKGGCN